MSLSPDDLAFLAGLEQQLSAETDDQRGQERFALRLAVSLTPADTSRASESAIVGHTANLSVRGALTELQQPARVGDHYRVRLFTREDESREPLELIARCLRCGLLSESRFEVVLQFLVPLTRHDLPLSVEP